MKVVYYYTEKDSTLALDPIFAFVGDRVAPYWALYLLFFYVKHIANFAIRYYIILLFHTLVLSLTSSNNEIDELHKG
jgi:hypothetical protein